MHVLGSVSGSFSQRFILFTNDLILLFLFVWLPLSHEYLLSSSCVPSAVPVTGDTMLPLEPTQREVIFYQGTAEDVKVIAFQEYSCAQRHGLK